MGMRSTVFSPYAVGVASRVGAQINSFALIMVASRALDLTTFGSYAIAWAFTVIFTTLVYTGVYHVFLRAKSRDNAADTIFWLQIAMGALGGAVMLVLGAVSSTFGSDTTAFALFALAPIPLIAAYGAWNEAQLVRQSRIRTTSLAVLAAEVTGLVAAILLFQLDYGVEALVASRYAATMFTAALLTVLVGKRPRFAFRRDVARRALKEAWPLWGSSSLGMSSTYAADLVLAAFLTPAAVGAYRAGARVANTAADVVLQPLGTISWARFARLEAHESSRQIGEVWTQNMALGFTLIAPVMVSISLLSETLVNALFDPTWGAVAGIVSVLALARMTSAFGFLLEPTMACLGRPRVQFYVSVASVTLLLTLLISVGRFSLETAVWAVFANGVAMAIVSIVLMLRVTGVRVSEFLNCLTPGLALTVLCVAAIYALDPTRNALAPLPGLSVTLAALALVWLGFVGVMLRRGVLVLPTP